jgi:hypothetical protein
MQNIFTHVNQFYHFFVSAVRRGRIISLNSSPTMRGADCPSFLAMVFFGNSCHRLCPTDCLIEKIFCDRGIEFCDIEGQEWVICFVANVVEPFNHWLSVFPLIDLEFRSDCIVDACCPRWFCLLFKVSYSCTENVKSAVSRHNHRILSKRTKATNTSHTTARTVPDKKCNCRNANECPLGKRCLESSLVYQAEVITRDNWEIKH